jgi:transcriptional regulator GlxA family with amidase domain
MKAATVEITRLKSIGMSALALAGMEDLLMNLAVASLFPTVARMVGEAPPDCGPAAILRARDHINEHAADPIEFSRLANDLGISMRAMQANFRRYFGVSPRDYLLECRLERARGRLLLADPDATVTTVALDSGFTDLSHFSVKYRNRYGELPSVTLRLALRRFS